MKRQKKDEDFDNKEIRRRKFQEKNEKKEDKEEPTISHSLKKEFKKSGDRLCVDIDNGSCRWMKPDCHASVLNLYTMDANNNFMPIKEMKSDVPNQVKDIP